MGARELARAWKDYRKKGSKDARQRLILNYLPMVKQVVGRMLPALPRHLITDELLSAGVVGLIESVEKFDPDCGTKFETYARMRIKGAILDELRKYDLAPRSLRKKARTVAAVYSALEQELGRTVTAGEVGAQLLMSSEEVSALVAKVNTASVISLNAEQGGSRDGDAVEIIDTIQDVRAEPPESGLERAEARAALEEGINALNEQEKVMIVLYYYEELTLKEIGAVLGVSESRVSQIHTKAVAKLRSKLSGMSVSA